MSRSDQEAGVVGARIREARQALGLSQIELAELVRVSQPTIAHWEQGTHAPRQLSLARLSDALGVSRAWLLDGLGALARPRDQRRSSDGRSYLTRPMRHAPVYLWPSSLARAQECLSGAAAPLDHLPISWDLSSPVCFLLDQAESGPDLPDGAVVVIDVADRTPREDCTYVVAAGDRLKLDRSQDGAISASSVVLGRVRLSIHRW